jgi:hypothetical protein
VYYAQGGNGNQGNFTSNIGDGGCGTYEGGNGSSGNRGEVVLRYSSDATIALNGVSGSTIVSGNNKITTITSGSGFVSWS